MKRWIDRLRGYAHYRLDRPQAELDGALSAQEARNIAWVLQNMQLEVGPSGELLHRKRSCH